VEDDAAVVAQRPDLGISLIVPISLLAHMIVTRMVSSRIALLDHLRGDHAVGAGLEVGDLEALLLQTLARVERRLVLVLGGDDVPADLARPRGCLGVHRRRALDRQVVRLGRAAREDDLLAVRADQPRDLPAGGLDRVLRDPAEAVVPAARVAVVSVKYGSIASTTRGSHGVVAALSK
jgi:hypothetical protein